MLFEIESTFCSKGLQRRQAALMRARIGAAHLRQNEFFPASFASAVSAVQREGENLGVCRLLFLGILEQVEVDMRQSVREQRAAPRDSQCLPQDRRDGQSCHVALH